MNLFYTQQVFLSSFIAPIFSSFKLGVASHENECLELSLEWENLSHIFLNVYPMSTQQRYAVTVAAQRFAGLMRF